ncbi:hypothetical protein C0Q70_16243 [Pomacea canaliculata]|uniref:Isopenicillin N synthase-like Fe(2+) 2OG dioxygenase domain-containing protein n=2 Tax=Pomacea canaliculata TaxID=400727 RepID=A0A2T7NPA5_POMCA|nr:hypothetical protein C0Q70_16243 [Pomacea canaliculata]
MLSAMSGGRFKATCHRVVDTGVDRMSVPFFFEPNYDADISCIMPSGPVASSSTATTLQQFCGKKSKVAGGTQYGTWLIEKMRSFAEYRDILSEFKFGSSGSRA